jgi:hypothetical protein
VESLLSHGIDPTVEDKCGATRLLNAAAKSRENVLGNILRRANAIRKDLLRRNILHLDATSGSPATVKLALGFDQRRNWS